MLSTELARELDMMDRDAIDGMIRRFWAARLADATAAIHRYTSPDVAFRIVGAGGPAGGLAFDGHEAVIEAVRSIDVNVEFLSFDVVDLIIDGRNAALFWRATLRNRGTGVVGDLAVFDLITVENGLVAAYTEFLDTDGFQRIMSGEPQAPSARRSNRAPAVPAAAPRAPAVVDLAERDRIEAILRAFRQARAVIGAAAIDEFCTEDCVMQIIGDPATVPFARQHQGRAAVRELVEKIDLEFICESLEVRQVLVDDDRAAVHWLAEIRHRGTGAQGAVQGLDHIVMTGGRISAITEFFDTATTATLIAG